MRYLVISSNEGGSMCMCVCWGEGVSAEDRDGGSVKETLIHLH